MQDKQKQIITDAIKQLTLVYNSGEAKPIEKVVEALRPLMLSQHKITPIRADKLSSVKSAPFYSTGSEWADEWLSGGWRKEELILIAGEPFIGKTHLMTWFSANLVRQGATVAHFFAEDLKTDVRDYYISTLPKAGLNRLWLVDMIDYRFGVREVESALEELKRNKVEIDAAVVDNVDIMTPPWGAEATEAGQLKAIMRDLRILAKRQDIILFAASQAHERGGDRKGAGRLFGSKVGKKGNADILILVDKVFGNQYRLSLEKAKGRKINPDTQIKSVTADWDAMEIQESE